MNDWTDEEFIAERTLERLRLGELSDEETQELLDRLEACGEMHRLEGLIEEDEEIRAHYPPAVMASHARERLRRRQRDRRSRGPKKRSRIPALAVAALVLGGAVGFVGYFSIGPGPATTPEMGAATPAQTTEYTPPNRPWRSMWNDFVWRQNDGDPNTNPVFACVSGEVQDLDASRVNRVTTDSAKRLGFESNDGVMRMTCSGEGSAIATFHRDDEPPRSVTVRIGEAYAGEVPAPECEVDGPAEVRVLVDPRGLSDKVLVAGRIDDPTQQCLRDWFGQQKWDAGGESWRVVVWTP